MKNLILIRHGKSEQDVFLKDIDRTLHQRGFNDAHLVAINCIEFLPKKFVMFSSVARRASQTAVIFAKTFLYPVENILFMEELYTFEEKELEKTIKSFSNNYNNVILFGHNEAITNFVNKFGDVFIDNVPTSGFISLLLDTDSWNDIVKGRTIKTIFPKDLK